jgi:hypothetical protein
MDDVKAYLKRLEKEVLHRLVMDQAFPLQRGLAFAEGLFHLVVAPEVEVDEVAVGAAVDRPAHDPDLVLTLHELAVLTKRELWSSPPAQL